MDASIVSTLSPEFLLGAVFVLVYALDRFNTPTSNRASTTAGRYYAAASAYLGVSLLFYWALTRYPQLLAFIPPVQGASADSVPDQTKLPPTVVVGMLLSVLLPKIPVVAHVDSRLRAFLQDLAEIPWEAIRIGKLIGQARFNPDGPLRDTIQSTLLSSGFNADDIVFDLGEGTGPTTPHALWVRIAALKHGIDSWESQRGFAGFIQRRREEYKALGLRYKQIEAVAKNCFSLQQAARTGSPDAPLADAVDKFRANYTNQAEELARSLSLFAAQGLLQCGLTRGTRDQALKSMGFDVPQGMNDHGLSVNRVLALFVILVPLLLLNFILFQRYDRNHEDLLIMVTMIGTIHMVAVVCAIYPKVRWGFFGLGDDDTRPVAAYMVSGLAAVVVSVPIQVAYKTLIKLDATTGIASAISMAWSGLQSHSYPWLLLAFTSAATTAFMADNRPSMRLPARRLCWLESIGQSLIFMLAASLVLWWLQGILPPNRLPDPITVLCTSVICGFVLGYLVPSWYREARAGQSTLASNDPAAARSAIPVPSHAV